MRREGFLLLAALAGIVASAASAVDMVPRVRTTEVITVFAGAFGGGAALVGAIVELRQARLRARNAPPSSRPGFPR